MKKLTAQSKWKIFGISPDTSHSPHAYYGTYAEVKEHCISSNKKFFRWDFITFELWED